MGCERSLLDDVACVAQSVDYDAEQKAFHAFCQERKKSLASKTMRDIVTRSEISWKVDDIDYNLHNVHRIGGTYNFYAIIDEDTLALPSETIGRFRTALTHIKGNGFGFKSYVDSKILKLTIDADVRLYATEVYENDNHPDKPRLVIFNKHANHIELKRISVGERLKVVKVPYASSSTPNLGDEELGDDVAGAAAGAPYHPDIFTELSGSNDSDSDCG